MSTLLDFYRGLKPDTAGRMIEDIWAWDARRLEMVHDYIQWLFPLPAPSRFNPEAPLLSTDDIAAFRATPLLQDRVRRSLDLMLDFYGLARVESAVLRAGDFPRKTHWLTPLNHNHLRLTRIMLFLRYAGLIAEADGLRACLLEIAAAEGRDAVSERTLGFWRETGAGPGGD